MWHHLQINLNFLVLFASLTSLSFAARLSPYIPLSDQTYQDLLRQQFSQSQLQQVYQQQQQRQQQQQQRQQFTPQVYENGFSYIQQAAELGQNYRNLKNLPVPYAQQIPHSILTPYNQQQPQQQQRQQGFYRQNQPIFYERPNLVEQYPSQYPTNAFPSNNLGATNEEGYKGANSLEPYYNRDFLYERQKQIGLPSSRDFVQLPTAAGLQLSRQSSRNGNVDYAAHFDSYLRKYPQRLEPRFGVQSYL